MLVLINTNHMQPPIAPVGLDYVAGAAIRAGIETQVIDLCLAEDRQAELESFFANNTADLIGLSFRNVDDCFWPSAKWFVPVLGGLIDKIGALSNAPIVVGGVGYSIFPKQILEAAGADFGICGDGEASIVKLYNELKGAKCFEKVEGLLWRNGGDICANAPAWPEELSLVNIRDAVDNEKYFALGGQCGIETKRGCDRKCLYCADPIAKGPAVRMRSAVDVVDEMAILCNRGIDVFHICDAEFNMPAQHATEVCEEIIRRNMGQWVRWYCYMSVRPFDKSLSELMHKAGCLGIDFTTDSASPLMLRCYRQPYMKQDIGQAVKYCKDAGIRVMTDLLLGGPGETKQTVTETIDYMKSIAPDCVGAGLGVRIYPGTGMADIVIAEGDLESNPNIRRKYEGKVDFLKPTFYIARSMGPSPAQMVRDIIGDDKRFFPPALEAENDEGHNYNDNTQLCDAIKNGARGAYWDILRNLRDQG